MISPQMTPPTPAAVRAAMKELIDWTLVEREAWSDEPRFETDILRDHISAVCAEMRAKATIIENAGIGREQGLACRYHAQAEQLRYFVDKLEGSEP